MVSSTNNLQLFTKNYIIENPKANVFIVHGLGEHCQRYAHVAKAFNEVGISVYTFDLRGHGQSEGERAFVKDMHEYTDDAEAVFETVPKDLPLFIVGHSLGGLLTLMFLSKKYRKEITGAVFSGSALEIGDDVTPTTQKIITFLAKFLPKLKTVKIEPTSISRDKKTVEDYDSDPLNYHGGVKAGTGLAMLKAIAQYKPLFKDFNYPVLIMHGGADKVTNIEGSKAFYAQARSQDKTLKIWEGAFHEIFNETNQDEVIKLMTDWVVKRI